MAEAKQTESKKTFYIVLIIILILLNGFFAYMNIKTRQQNRQLKAEKEQLQSQFDSVSAALDLRLAQLDSLYALTGELETSLEQERNQLEQAKQKIESLLQENKVTKAQLSDAKRMIASLKAENKKYLARIDTLTSQVEFLTQLSDSLSTNLQEKQMENKQLKSDKLILSQKVALGSLLKPEKIEINGVRFKSNNRKIPTRSAKKAEKLEICFDVPENKVAEPGEKTLLIRLINPQGSTIAISSQGSGVFEVAETGEQKQYTTMASFEYNNQRKPICVMWSRNPTTPFAKGTYTAVFYQNGYKLRETEFELR